VTTPREARSRKGITTHHRANGVAWRYVRYRRIVRQAQVDELTNHARSGFEDDALEVFRTGGEPEHNYDIAGLEVDLNFPSSARSPGLHGPASQLSRIRRWLPQRYRTATSTAADSLRGLRTAVLTVSTSVSRRENEDLSGPALAALAEAAGCDIAAMEVVPDDFALIEDRLQEYIDQRFDLIFTTGGTGLTPDDVTPEATEAVIERRAPGFSEAMRAESIRITAHGVLQRGVSGISRQTLIVNFPGSPKAVKELFPVIAPALPHAVATLRGDSRHGR
jgi:molybdenum cofactor synthesis domain-containing protein